jgi:hypothetical protein
MTRTTQRGKETVKHLEVDVMPHTCYIASDKTRPRWRFLLGITNRSSYDFTLKSLRIIQYAAGRRQQVTLPPDMLSHSFAQGSIELNGNCGAVLDIQEPANTKIAVRSVTVRLLFQQQQTYITLSRYIRLVPRRTRYFRFPLHGTWLTANSRTELHCVGTQFGFDFIRPKEKQIHDHPPTRKMRLDEFPSYTQNVQAPASGIVIQAVGDQPDFQPTLTNTTFPDGPPANNPKAVIGNYIALRADTGEFLLMAHLQQGSVCVKPDQRVLEGQIVGKVGNSGNTSGPHLHIETLDGEPDWSYLFTWKFQQSGVPFGFRASRRGMSGKQTACVCVIPLKDQVISR